MVIGKDKLETVWGEFADLGEFAGRRLKDGRFSVAIERARFECMLAQGTEPRLFVLLSGARDPSTQPLPKFDRWSWSEMFPGTVLCISDPTLALAPDRLHIGWYIGAAECDVPRMMADLVRAVAARLGVPDDCIICYGSSAGGFGSIMLAAELGNGTAVAINPQTDVGRYFPRYVKDLLDVGFSGRDLGMLDGQERQRFSAIEKLRRAPETRCLIAQNVQDPMHHREHYMPLCDALHVPLEGGLDESARIMSFIFDSPLGHGPEPKELAPELIRLGVALSRMGKLQSTSNNQAGTLELLEAEMIKPPQADTAGTLTLRSVPLSDKPVWIDVEQGTLAALELHAELKGWPTGSRGTALAMLELAEDVTPLELKSSGIAHSAIGPYVYLDHHVANGVLNWTLTIPRGKIVRIGLRLWGWKKDIVLENLRLTPRGGTLTVRTTDQEVPLFKDVAESEDDVLAVDLLHDRNGCTEACAAKAMHWYGSMDAYQSKSPAVDLGRTNCFFKVEQDEYAHVSAFHAWPAMLEVPEAIDVYAQRIGDKSRNMVRKAVRAGYVYMAVDPNQYIDDVVEIRTSAPVRQGREIPAYFHQRPRTMLAQQWCDYHGDAFYGIFKDGKLVAYITLFMYGQLAQVNHFLGHADHMKEGVMNLLMYEVVSDLIKNRPWVRAINYMYAASTASASGTALFKRSMGFEARRLMMAHRDPGLANLLDAKRQQRAQARAAEAGQAANQDKSVPKIDSAELGDALVVHEFNSGAAALDSLLQAAADGAAMQLHRFAFDPAGAQCAAPELLGATAIVVDGIDASNVVKFLSAGFKQFRNSVAKGAFVLFDFPSDLQAGRTMDVAGDDQADPLQTTIDYFKRRFKSATPGPEAVRDGFKGSDFVVKALVSYQDGARSGNSTLLLLKKIR